MGLFELIGRESTNALRKLAAMAAVSGLANALVLAVINAAATFADSPVKQLRLLVMFAIVLTTYIIAERYILVQSIAVVESVLNQIRLRLAERIRAADLSPIEKIGRSTIYSCASKELISISQAATTVIGACQSSLLVVFSLIYLAILSQAAFFITLIVTFIGISIHFQRRTELIAGMRMAIQQENAFLDTFTQMLDGFKEMKLNRPLGDAIADEVKLGSERLTNTKILVAQTFSSHAIFSQAAFYVMIACIVFLLPKFHQANAAILTKATTTILFIVGPLTALIGSIPLIAQANVAAGNVRDLEARLSSAVECPIDHPSEPVARTEFSEIQLDRLRFEYLDATGDTAFALGPLDLTIRSGETIFLIGGNGSGKSTFLRLLTSLYFPRSGSIRFDNVTVGPANLEEYRSLFGVIFSDYHLFDRLYGQQQTDVALINRLIERFELKGKVEYDGTRWSTTALSTGQRKRLALIVTWLDNRPIHVFDEWAADQDPAFRRFFYEVLLPEMKSQGKTVIAATHDDRYFHLADRVVCMEFGNFRQEGASQI